MPLFNLKHTLATERLSCRVDAVHATYSVYDVLKNQFVIENAAFGIQPPGPPTSPAMFAGEHFVLNEEASEGDSRNARFVYKHSKYPIGLTLEVAVSDEDTSAITLRLGFTNRSAKPMGLRALYPMWIDPQRDGAIDLGGVWSRGSMLRNGYMSASDCTIEHFSKPDGTQYDSHWFTLLHHLVSKRNLALGFLTVKDQVSRIIASPDTDGMHMTAKCETDESHVGPGATQWSETLWMRVTDDPNAQLDRYARLSAAANCGEDAAVKPPRVGWTTRDLSDEPFTQADIEENLLWLVRHKKQILADYVLIDEGWQMLIGDWGFVESTRFAEGLAPVAARIRAAGFEPGLWIAPFIAQQDSVLFTEHPTWFLRDSSGRPANAGEQNGVMCHALDCTNPEALARLKETIATIVNEWGFTHLKLDHLYCAALEDTYRFDPHMTRAQAYRMGLDAIRDAAGDAVYLQGCAAPLGASIGVLDSLRVEPATSASWEVMGTGGGIRPAGKNSLIRGFLSGHWYRADHDCLPLGAGTELTNNERVVRETLLALCGDGVAFTGSLASALPEHVAALRCLIPALAPAALAWDPLSRHDSPHVLIAGNGDAKLLALFNWTDSADPLTIDFNELGFNRTAPHLVYDALESKLLTARAVREYVGPPVPPRSVRLLTIAPTPGSSRPALLASTFHVSQGAAEVVKSEWTRTSLELALKLPSWVGDGGKLTFFAPEITAASVATAAGADDVTVDLVPDELGTLMVVNVNKIASPDVTLTITLAAD
ncbi:MAG TPA: glycoside hydrolase family 36 protein [Capsulimonadaceae bacterium]